MKQKQFLSVGTWVWVKATVVKGFFCTNDKISLDKDRLMVRKEVPTEKPPVEGVIVGGTYFQEGTVRLGVGSRGYHDDYDYDYDFPSYLEIKKTHFLYLVRQGFTNKALMVLPKDLEPTRIQDSHSPLPFRHALQPPFSKECRREMSEWSKEYPRDKKGRWKKNESKKTESKRR